MPSELSQVLSFTQRYSPDQPRDDHGRFGEGSGDKEKFLEKVNKLNSVEIQATWAGTNKPAPIEKALENPIPREPSEMSEETSKALKLAIENKDYTEMDVSISKITSRQTWVKAANLEHIYDNKDEQEPATAIKSGNHYIILDGNHRAATLLLSGDKTISLKVWNIENK